MRVAGVGVVLLAVLVTATGCGSSGVATNSGTPSSRPAMPTTSGASGATTSTASTSGSSARSAGPLTVAAFLTPGEIGEGYRLADSQFRTGSSKSSSSSVGRIKNLGCLDPTLADGPAGHPTTEHSGVAAYVASGGAKVFIEEISEYTTAAAAQQQVAKVTVLQTKCKTPRVTLGKTAFTETHTFVLNGASGCDSAVNTETHARRFTNQLISAELDTYVVSKGRWLGVAYGYAPETSADLRTAARRPVAMCARLPGS